MSTGTTNVELKSDREVIITRAFAAPAHLVWEAMSKPEYVRRWYGLKILECVVCEIDSFLSSRPIGSTSKVYRRNRREVIPLICPSND